MKQKCVLILVVVILVFLHSCKKQTEPNPVVIEPIDSTKIPAQFKYTSTILDSGGVKFTNHSKNISSFKWYTYWYKSKAENPTFYFEENGTYSVIVYFFDEKIKMVRDTTLYVKIDNVPLGTKIDSSYLSGEIYKNSVNLISPWWNDFYGGGFASLPMGTPSARTQQNGFWIAVADFNAVQGKDYATMKSNFKVGKQTLAQLTSYPTSDYSLKQRGWYVVFGGKYGFYATGNSPDDFLEILEIKEVYQKKLFPEIDERAFWVTWHVKADTGERGKIDCIFKTKYVIYQTYFDF